jgi:hypothetical protein
MSLATRTPTIVVIKYSPQGERLWTRTKQLSDCSDFGGMGTAIGRDGNLFVAGLVRSGTQNGYRVLRYQPDGTCLTDTAFWHSNAGGNFPSYSSYPLCVGMDGLGCIYSGGTTQSESTSFDIVTGRFAPDGTQRWTRLFDGQRHDFDAGFALSTGAGGNALVAGGTVDASNHEDAVVLSYDTAGTLQWAYAHRANTNYGSRAYGIAADGSGICVAGTSSNGTLVLRLAQDGDSIWSRDDSGAGRGVALDSSGNAFVAGSWTVRTDVHTMRLWKYDRTGRRLWRKDYYGSDTLSTATYFIAPGGDQGVYVAGYRLPDILHPDYMVAKYDSAGTKVWSAFGGDSSDTHSEIPGAVAVDRDGNMIMTGTSKHTDGTEEILTMKFRASGAVEEQPMTPVESEHDIRASPSVVSSRCRFSVPAGDRQSVLRIVDIAGRMVRAIPVSAGKTDERVAVTWDTRDEQGRTVPNGVYFVTLASGSARSSCKVIVQRK